MEILGEHFVNPAALIFASALKAADGKGRVLLTELFSGEYEGYVVKYEIGAIVPRHSHSQPTTTIVLSGCFDTREGKAYPGTMLKCDGAYGPREVKEEVYLLVIQLKGTRYIVDAPDTSPQISPL